MKRRAFIAGLGGVAVWPTVALAQQPDRIRRIGVLSALPEHDPESVARRAAFERALQALGWTAGRNLQIDYRWSRSDPASLHKFAAELAALAPDVIVTSGSITFLPMLQAASATPIVFTQVIDPVGSSFLRLLAPDAD